MSQTKAYRTIGLCISAALLCAVSCVVESSNNTNDGEGGTTSETGGESSTTTKTGGATGKGGSNATGGNTGVGGTTSSAGGTVAAAAGTNSTSTGGTTSSTSAAGSTSSVGNAGTSTTGAGGTAGSTGSGVAGAAGTVDLCTDPDQSIPVEHTLNCQGIPATCSGSPSAALKACTDSWALYKPAVALNVEQCLQALVIATIDLCDVGFVDLISVCTTSTVGFVCPTSMSTTVCSSYATGCGSSLDASTCKASVAAHKTITEALLNTCMAATTTTDCNDRLAECLKNN